MTVKLTTKYRVKTTRSQSTKRTKVLLTSSPYNHFNSNNLLTSLVSWQTSPLQVTNTFPSRCCSRFVKRSRECLVATHQDSLTLIRWPSQISSTSKIQKKVSGSCKTPWQSETSILWSSAFFRARYLSSSSIMARRRRASKTRLPSHRSTSLERSRSLMPAPSRMLSIQRLRSWTLCKKSSKVAWPLKSNRLNSTCWRIPKQCTFWVRRKQRKMRSSISSLIFCGSRRMIWRASIPLARATSFQTCSICATFESSASRGSHPFLRISNHRRKRHRHQIKARHRIKERKAKIRQWLPL